MKKRVLATILSVCLLFSVVACVANAEGSIFIGEIISSKRICPGDIIDFDFIERPETEGGIYAEGWEVETADGVWVPYDGEPISEDAGTFGVRYFATDANGNYSYSNECLVTAKHNPAGQYETSGTYHWRICADCGAETDKGGHDHLSSTSTSAEKVCTVCGHIRTSQWTGMLVFWEFIMSIIVSLIG